MCGDTPGRGEGRNGSDRLITAIVLFDLPPGTTRARLLDLCRETAPDWRANPYLVRKNYLYDPEQRQGGGVYTWRDRAAAEHCLDEGFRARLAQRFGSAPRILFFETPVVVDNLLGQVLIEEPAPALTR